MTDSPELNSNELHSNDLMPQGPETPIPVPADSSSGEQDQENNTPPPPAIQDTSDTFAGIDWEDAKTLMGWSTFWAIVLLITGVFNSLTIIGLIWGVPMIIMGIRLLGAKKDLGELISGRGTIYDLNSMIANLATYFKWSGIIAIIGFIIGLAMVFIFVVAGYLFHDLISEILYNYIELYLLLPLI